MNYIEWVFQNPILAFLLLLVEYIVIMLLASQKRFKTLAKILTIPFVLQDFVVNVIVITMLSAVFLEFEWPQEALVTARLKRWKTLDYDTRRSRFAWFMCDILNKYDENHC